MKKIIAVLCLLLASCKAPVRETASSVLPSETPAATEEPRVVEDPWLVGDGIMAEEIEMIRGSVVGRYNLLRFEAESFADGYHITIENERPDGEKYQVEKDLSPESWNLLTSTLEGHRMEEENPSETYTVHLRWQGMSVRDRQKYLVCDEETYALLHATMKEIAGIKVIEETPAPEEEDTSLADLQKQITDEKAVLGSAMVTSAWDIGYPELASVLRREQYAETYPFTERIDADHFVTSENGMYLFLIVPADESISAAVTNTKGEVIYHCENGEPFFLLAGYLGVSTVDITVVSDDEVLTYTPMLDLNIDAPAKMEGVYDFTMWADAGDYAHQAQLDLLYYDIPEIRNKIYDGMQLKYGGHVMVEDQPCTRMTLSFEAGERMLTDSEYAVTADLAQVYVFDPPLDQWMLLYDKDTGIYAH